MRACVGGFRGVFHPQLLFMSEQGAKTAAVVDYLDVFFFKP